MSADHHPVTHHHPQTEHRCRPPPWQPLPPPPPPQGQGLPRLPLPPPPPPPPPRILGGPPPCVHACVDPRCPPGPQGRLAHRQPAMMATGVQGATGAQGGGLSWGHRGGGLSRGLKRGGSLSRGDRPGMSMLGCQLSEMTNKPRGSEMTKNPTTMVTVLQSIDVTAVY